MIRSSALLLQSTANQDMAEDQEGSTPQDDAAPPTAKEAEPRPGRRLLLGGFSFFSGGLLTLTIEGTSLRIMTVRGQAITGWMSVPLEPQLLRNGAIADSNAMGQAISAALNEGDVQPGSVICAFPSFQTLTRVITLPPAAKRNLEDVVEREARRLMSFTPENNYLLWQRLPPQRGQERVYAITAPREQLTTFIDSVRLAGLRPTAIDLHPLALARAVNQANAIIAHGENNSFEVIIVVDGVPTLIRTSFLGEQPLNLEYVATRLTDELTRTILYYNDTNRERPLDPTIPVYVTGEMGTVPSIVKEITDLTSRPLPSLEAPLSCPAEVPLPQFMANLGLVLKKR